MSTMKIILLLMIGIFFLTCENKLMNSPDPGTIDIYLKVVPGTWTIGDSDTLFVNLNQMAVYRADSVWSRIYRKLSDFRDKPLIINLFEKDSLGEFPVYEIGNTNLPPNVFTRLEFMFRIYNEMSYKGVKYPVVAADSIAGEAFGNIVKIHHTIEIKKNETTTIHLTLNLGESLYRKFDSYVFAPKITVDENL